jgi:hypothetical protein
MFKNYKVPWILFKNASAKPYKVVIEVWPHTFPDVIKKE